MNEKKPWQHDVTRAFFMPLWQIVGRNLLKLRMSEWF